MEEIKAGDIMIGNYIRDVWSPNGFFKVTQLKKYSAEYGKDFTALYENLRPIPLTEDILVKAGFRKHRMSGSDAHFIYSIFLGGEVIEIMAIYNADFSIRLHSNARKVKYVHDLQNKIKALTGNDLKIEV